MSNTIYAVVYDGEGDVDTHGVIDVREGRESLDEALLEMETNGEIDGSGGYSVYELKKRGPIKIETKITF